jgi:cell division protein FtsQ
MIASHARAGVLEGGRRWTVVLDSGVELMLPEDNPAAALANVAKLDADNALLSRAISVVDLRAPGQVVVRLDADGMAQHAALLKARAKLAKAKT